MKKTLKKFSGMIVTEYLVCLIRYNSSLNTFGFWHNVRTKVGLFPFLFKIFFKQEKKKIDEVFVSGRSSYDWGEISGMFFLTRRTAKVILRWMFFEEIILPGQADRSCSDDITLIFRGCISHLRLSDMDEFLDELLDRCGKYYVDKDSWLYSPIGDNLISILEYLAHACFRKEELEKIADFMVARRELNTFENWHRVIDLYFKSGTRTAVLKIRDFGSRIFSEQWCDDYEWGPIGPYTNTLSMELARNICIENDLYNKDPSNDLCVFVHRWFDEASHHKVVAL